SINTGRRSGAFRPARMYGYSKATTSPSVPSRLRHARIHADDAGAPAPCANTNDRTIAVSARRERRFNRNLRHEEHHDQARHAGHEAEREERRPPDPGAERPREDSAQRGDPAHDRGDEGEVGGRE